MATTPSVQKTGPAGPSSATRRPRRRRVDAVLAEAVGLARDTAVEAAEPGTVGEHLGATADQEAERLVAHAFACTADGYRGWHWLVVLTRAPRSKKVTVNEVVLVPGPEALLAPAWVPWAERLSPADVTDTDLLPRIEDDPRLEQGYEATGDEDGDRLAIWELGLGRRRVLTREGRAEAAERWYDGSHGPHTEGALAAPEKCASCGFLMALSGSLRTMFGVCANEWSGSDGMVVSLDHGCGAHSETDVPPQPSPSAHGEPVLDELGPEDAIPLAD